MNENIDFGNMTSRDIGNLMSKTRIERGKEIAKSLSKDGNVNYGNLSSKTLPELGKQAILNDLNNN